MTTNFVTRGTEIIKSAVDKDNESDYESALNLYLRGVEFLMTGMKYEKNVRVNAAIREKVYKYLERAEYIKTSLIQNNDDNDNGNNSQKKNKKSSKSSKKHKLKKPKIKPKTKDSSMNSNNNNSNNNKDNECKENNENKDDSNESMSDSDDSDNENDEDRAKLKAALKEVIVIEKPNVKWDDIAGLEVAKSLLQETVILPQRFPQLYKGKRKPLSGILLYGPPGTGKSYLAKAVATEANDATFFSVSSSDLVSKYVGESEKLIKELYKMARKMAPSIIFIDEIDSLVTKRSDNEQANARRIKTEFLVQMQGVGKSTTGVLTLGATNCPWDLDPAIRRRFGKRIYIPLPDETARKAMFEIHVGNNEDNNNEITHGLSDEDFDLLASKTEGFSGSDIGGIVQDALMEPVRTLRCATHFKKIYDNNNNNNNGNKSNDYKLVPCSPNDPQGIKMRLMEISKEDQNKVEAEKLKLCHFLRILQSSKASVGNEDLERQMEWTKQFGQDGS